MPRKRKQQPTFTSIYALVDPLDNVPFYVGATKHTTEWRLKRHIVEAKMHKLAPSYKEERIQSILARGMSPTVITLEVCEHGLTKDRESYWIRELNRQAVTLTNKNAVKAGDPVLKPREWWSSDMIDVMQERRRTLGL